MTRTRKYTLSHQSLLHLLADIKENAYWFGNKQVTEQEQVRWLQRNLLAASESSEVVSEQCVCRVSKT